ncbi:MAG: type I glyceraldehyde-3-phosphate dehydrogenase [Nanoarchaeota archaeon]
MVTGVNMRIAINGFGRIGRNILRVAMRKNLNVVAVNDVHGVKDAAYLLKYDSVYGKFPGSISVKGNSMIVNGKTIHVISERDIEKLPWKKFNVDIVVESTGVFRSRKDALRHISSGAKKVVVTAPMKDADITMVPGVNGGKLNHSCKLLSVASCTTNCTAVVMKVLNDYFGVKKALFTTAHGYTSSQALVDSSDEKSPRRGRAAAINIVPTTTGASETVVETIPELKGKINGLALRVPVVDGSIVDIVAELKKPFDIKKINAAFKNASKKELKGILEYSEEELVSADIIGNPHSAVFDSKLTEAEGNLVKVLAWYDNEYGYSCRVVDVIKLLGRK